MPLRKRKATNYAESDDDDDSSSDDFVDGGGSGSDDSSLAPSVNSSDTPKKKKATTKKESPAKSKAPPKTTKASPQKKKAAELKTATATSKSSTGNTSTTAVASSSSNNAAARVEASTAIGGVDITQGPPVVTEAAAKKLILQYMKQQNRPYSMIQIHDNLHKRVPKATLEKVLTATTAPGGGLLCKEYGKAKIYYVDQTTLTSDFSPEQLEALQDENEELKQQVQELTVQEKELRNRLHVLENQPNDDDLDRVLQEYEERVAEKEGRVKSLMEKTAALATTTSGGGGGGGGGKKGAAEGNTLQNAIKKFNTTRMAWFTRRSMCMDALDMLGEGLNKKHKDLMADLCLEVDEDVGHSLPAMMKEPKS